MIRIMLALFGALAVVTLAAGCRRTATSVRATDPEPSTTATHPEIKLRASKPEAAAILGTGLIGAAPAGPLALTGYANFVLDTANLLDLTPRYDRPIVAGLLGAGLSGAGAAGPWSQLVYADIAHSSFDRIDPTSPSFRPRVIRVKVSDLDLRPLPPPGAPGGGQPKAGGKAKGGKGKQRPRDPH